MDVIGRKKLPHDAPLGIGVGGQVFFVTVCIHDRSEQTLLKNGIPEILLSSVSHRQERGIWYVRVFVVMPDHVHFLVRLPQQGSLRHEITQWKRWTAKQGGFSWQRDFFDHRLRSEESENGKADYILRNPVRAGLSETPEDWPYLWIGGR